jgi:hypothetical protein
MANMPNDQKFKFDVELSITAPFSGVAQLLGTLVDEPVVIIFKNQSTVPVFLADNSGATNGTTMAVNEIILIDCRANKGQASNGGFPIGTSFFVTGTAGTGFFKVSIIYAT